MRGILQIFFRFFHKLSGFSPKRLKTTQAKNSRQTWDDNKAHWYRLRYNNAEKMTDAINRLSRVGGGRTGMRWRYSDSGTLECWIGVEARYQSPLEEMSGSFQFTVTSTGRLPDPLSGVFVASSGIDIDDASIVAVDAYVVNGALFVLVNEGRNEIERIDGPTEESEGGRSADESIFFPTASHIEVANTMLSATGGPGHTSNKSDWRMPEPMLGTSNKMQLDIPTSPHLLRQPSEWLLGWDRTGKSVGGKQVGVLGKPESVESWLYSLILNSVQENARNLVLLDGSGELAKRLMGNPNLNRMLLQGYVTHLDVKKSAQTSFNPLIMERGGDIRKTWVRWRWWFHGMGVHTEFSDDLLLGALKSNVRTIPDFYQWLDTQKKTYPKDVVALQAVIRKLDKDEQIREWLFVADRFTDPRILAERGLLLVSCPMSGSGAGGIKWAREQAMRAFLGVLIEVNSSFIFHGYKPSKSDRNVLGDGKFIVADAVLPDYIVTQCSPSLSKAASSHMNGLNVKPEHLTLLPDKTAVMVRGDKGALVSWKKRWQI